jgi:hypothetical protein
MLDIYKPMAVESSLIKKKISGYVRNHIRLYFRDHVTYFRNMMGMLLPRFQT